MNSLYFILLLTSAFVPFVLSFDKKLHFYKQWKYLFPSIIVIAGFYILFDIALAAHDVWGFNPKYHSAVIWLGLPIEEFLFFIIIPYASIFLHDSMVLYFDNLKISNRNTKVITISLIIISLIIIILNIDKIYSVYIFSKVIVVLLISLYDKSGLMNRLYITFLIILLPFIMVNGILTGSLINESVVWYNEQEILGIRIFTIPIEDSFYAFSLISFVLLLRIKVMSILGSNIHKII
ncbi:lycopene cyclase domain-containing protein [Bacteroidales bacterium]|nr:lycopene cyclase domain-containing protein [Bacteroidales bacterium]